MFRIPGKVISPERIESIFDLVDAALDAKDGELAWKRLKPLRRAQAHQQDVAERLLELVEQHRLPVERGLEVLEGVAEAYADNPMEPYSFTIDKTSVHLYQLLNDFRGENIGVLEMTTERVVTGIGATALRFAAVLIVLTSAAFLLASLAFMAAPGANAAREILRDLKRPNLVPPSYEDD